MDQLQKAQFLEILEKYHAGNASKEEVEFLDAYYKAFGLRNGYTDYLTEEDRLLLKNELKNSISKKISTYQRSEIKTNNRNIFQWSISVAAAIIIIAAAGLFFYSPNKNAEQPAKLTIKKDIAPFISATTALSVPLTLTVAPGSDSPFSSVIVPRTSIFIKTSPALSVGICARSFIMTVF